MDPLEQRYADEHRRFLEENNPSVLSRQSDPSSYLSSVGETAAQMHRHLMFSHLRSPAVQKLPFPDQGTELQNRLREVEELVRHDHVLQPVPEE